MAKFVCFASGDWCFMVEWSFIIKCANLFVGVDLLFDLEWYVVRLNCF